MNECSTQSLFEQDSSLETVQIVDLRGESTWSAGVQPCAATLGLADHEGRILAGRYVLKSVLGRGGMGQVYKALDLRRADLPEGQRYVAVKILHQTLAERPALLASLRREFYCAQALSHPNIVQVYETDCDGDLAFFTMEPLQGELLSALIDRARPQPLPRPYAWSIIRDVGAGIVHAHSRSVVHGDLKPQNVMITFEGAVRILDFGSSGARTQRRAAANLLQRDPVPAATPRYTCCELLEGQQTDPRDDLFALACLSYELLSGEHPFQGRDASEARELCVSPDRPPGLTGRQWRTLRQGLAWRRENRSIEVSEWLADFGLAPVCGRLAAARPVVAPARWHSAPLRRAALCAGIIAAIGGALVYGFASPRAGAGSERPMPLMPIASASVGVRGGGAIEPRVARAPAATSTPRAHQRSLRVAAKDLLIAPGEGFAEITVVRSEATGATSFMWWTEASTARANQDFVPQAPTMQSFSKGRLSTTLFVRILRNESRKHMQLLYVAVGKPNDLSASRRVARAAIWIPSQAGAVVASN